MASKGRLWGYCRRRVGLMVMMVVFVFLGYVGVAVMKSPYHYAYTVDGRGPLIPSQELSTEPPKPQQQEGRNDVSIPGVREVAAAPMVVLVLSSMPRGGSTLMTELLSAMQDSVVVFEPLWLIEKKDCYQDEACVVKYLADILSCNFKPEFEDWLKNKGLFFRYFSPEARRCQATNPAEAKVACLKAMKLQERCEAAPVVIVKVIRARLSWIHNLLEDSLINLKVIHLTRDPRGSLNSIARFGWDSNPHTRCSDLEEDMITYEKLRQLFPRTVTQVRYEQLCLRPMETTRDVFRFLFGNATLPAPVTTFLEKHMLSSGRNGGNMNTVKNSTKEFESWRYKISAKQLKAIEEEATCVQAITHMRHAFFGTHETANNPDIPLILTT